MAKPRASSGRAGSMSGDLFSTLSQILMGPGGVGAMPNVLASSKDGLRKFAARNIGTPYGPNPYGLSGVPLMQYWSSLDANTPDKMTLERMRDIYRRYPNSPYAKSLGQDIQSAGNWVMDSYFNKGGGYDY